MMGWENLVGYIQEQNALGYDLNAIKNHLISNGYPSQDVDFAIDYIYQQKSAVQPTDALVDYIYKQLSIGYSIDDIRDYLVNYGYDRTRVMNAISQVTQTRNVNVTHTFHVSRNVMVLVSFVLLFVLISSYLGYIMLSAEPIQEELLDVDSILLNPNQKLYAGNSLSFNVELFNFGSSQRYDVTLIHNVIDKIDRRSIIQKKETAAVEVRASKISRIQLPSTIKPGVYELETVAKYSGNVAAAIFEFVVHETPIRPADPVDPKPADPVDPKPADPVDPKPADPVDPKPADPVDPVDIFGYDDMNDREYFDLISGVKDTDKLAGICEKTSDVDLTRLCVTMLAINGKEQDTCLMLEQRSDLDFCLRTYALSNEQVEVCGQVESKASRDLCKMLINTANIFKTRDVSYDLDPWEAKINFDMDEAMANLDMQYLSGSDLSIFFSMFMVEN